MARTDPPDRGDNPEFKAFREEFEQRHAMSNERMQNELSQLTQMVSQLCGMNAVENVLTHGFEAISAQLAPLRDLAPQRIPLDPIGNAHLRHIRESLASPDWNGVYDLDDRRSGGQSAGEASPGVYMVVEQRSTLP